MLQDQDKNRVFIFDTTLRDGQQCPGAGMSRPHNLEYAKRSVGLGVDILEAGFPSASREDYLMFEAIAKELAGMPGAPVICGLCQLRPAQITTTLDALRPVIDLKDIHGNAPKHRLARLHVYLPVDPELMIASLGEAKANDKAALIRELSQEIRRVVSAGAEVEFSPEGYSCQGENFDFTSELIIAAVEAGAKVINCPDTKGAASIVQGDAYFVKQMIRHKEILDRAIPGNKVIWSTHNHNDLGLATSNTENAIFFGPARQVEGCINGVGERAGNTALEEIIMLIKRNGNLLAPENRLFTGIHTQRLQSISDFIAEHMLPRQLNKAIVGINASRHTSGGHTNAVINNPLAYQAIDPTEVGSAVTLVFGPLSGGNHAQDVIRRFGYVCADGEKATTAQYIKNRWVERRKGITDEELLQAYKEMRWPIKVSDFGYSKRNGVSEVYFKGSFFDETGNHTKTWAGNDSALTALAKAITQKFPGLTFGSYHADDADGGKGVHASGVSLITVNDGKLSYLGRGEDADIEISAMKALIDAVNQAFVERQFKVKAPSSEVIVEEYSV